MPVWYFFRCSTAQQCVRQHPDSSIRILLLSKTSTSSLCLLENDFEGDCTKITPNKGWIKVSVIIEEAEGLLQTEYNLYDHVTGKGHLGII